MFAGITWGQFGLFILVVVIVYYVVVILLYFRAELFGKIRKKNNPTDLVPAPVTTPVQVFSAVGSTADYGNSISNISVPVSSDNNNSNNLDSEESKDPEQEENTNDSNSGEINNSPELDNFSENDEDGFELQDQEEDMFLEDEVDLEGQFISFENADSIEVDLGGITVAELDRTVELLHQEEITITEKGELTKNLEMIEDTFLLQSITTNNSRAKEKLDLLFGDKFFEEEEPVKGEQVIKDCFSDVDVKQLIKHSNNF